MSIRKQPIANDEGFNYNNVDADEVNRSNAGLVGLKNLGNTCFINSGKQDIRWKKEMLLEYICFTQKIGTQSFRKD